MFDLIEDPHPCKGQKDECCISRLDHFNSVIGRHEAENTEKCGNKELQGTLSTPFFRIVPRNFPFEQIYAAIVPQQLDGSGN